MSVYTVHEPPQRTDDAIAHTARFVFVRDGFHFWAFLLAPLWLLRHRLWLEFIAYALILGGLTFALRRFGVSGSMVLAVWALVALLIGVEGSTLRRWKLARRGFANVGLVVGEDRGSAERRFFDSWVHEGFDERPARPAVPPPMMRSSAGPAPDIVGLFPQPGTRA